MMANNINIQDPLFAGPKPPFPEQKQEPLGQEPLLQPQANHGENTYRGSGRLNGMATLITGADSGIGRSVALAFAREGADVLVSYLHEDDNARQTAQLIQGAGRKPVLMAGDIRDEGRCRHLVDKAFEQFGRLDVLVNNAAYQLPQQEIEDISTEQFDRTFRTNVYAMFYLCKAAVPRMKPGSCIINTASIRKR